jgi:hypothetical protein
MEPAIPTPSRDMIGWTFIFVPITQMLGVGDGSGRELMRTRGEFARPVWLCLALGGAVVIAGLATGWSANSVRKLESPPEEMVGPRFGLNDPAPNDRQQPSDANFPFRASPSFQLASVPSGFVHSIPAEQAFGYISPSTGDLPFLRQTPDVNRSSRVEHDRDRLFNDAQLASIGARLKLNANQREFWGPVESALRAIRWSHDGAHKERSLDLNSEALKRLKTAAVPLMTTLREDQKEEVRTLTRLMGLEQLASQF